MRRPLLVVLGMLLALSTFAQTKSVTGTVSDQRDGQPLAGATVTAKGTNISVTTEPDGSFSIVVPASATTLVFTSVGFNTLEAPIGAGPVNVQLAVSENTLSEVIVTGYAVQNKRQVAGSISRIKGDEIKMQPIGSFDKALQGKIPGLLSMSSSGQPGAAATVTIRGKGSINGTNTPLYVIDGVQVTANDFATINPGDIESYNVLKDASSTAIYGSRGANGVIVITTRRGAAGQTRVNYDGQVGYSELPKNRVKLMNSAEKLQYEFYDSPYGANPNGWSDADVDSLSKINNGLEEALFRKGISQSHQVSASGGNDKTRFYLSGSIFDQQGVVRNTGLKRYTGRANIENTFSDFKIGLNASFGYSRLTNTREDDVYIGSPLNAIRYFNPYMNLYDAEGNYQYDFIGLQPNPLQEIYENFGNSDQLKGIGSVFIEYNLPWVKGLRLRTQWGGDLTQNETFNYFDRNTDQGIQATGGNGEVRRSYAKTFRYTGTTSLSFNRTFGDHEITAALYNEIIEGRSETFGFSGWGLVGPFKNESGITPGTPNNGYIPTVNGTVTRNGLVSYFFDGVYGYKGKYYLNFGARRDGSSRLSNDQQWANFGQVGASWIVSDEEFMASTRGWLSSLKYKISYGSAGSQGIGDFASLELLSPSVYNGVTGFQLTNLPRSLTWERKVMFNTGIEFSLWDGRIGGTFEYYNNITKDLFLNRQLSRTSGFASITNNLGELKNSGIEVSIDADIVRTKDFRWNISANYAHNKSKLVDQAGQDQNIDGLYINKVGQPINMIYTVRYAGVNPDNGEAQYLDQTGNVTETYSANYRQMIGPTDPPHYGGFGTNLNYKGIELDVLFSYAFGNYVYNNERMNLSYWGYVFTGLDRDLLTQWQKPGDVTNVPSAFSTFRSGTTRFVEKGDFLRLRNVMLAYNLPASMLSRAKIRSLRVFAQGQNLFVLHNFLGYDPEVASGMLGGGQYPQLKTVTFGVNLGL
ncbi:MAG: TonB-dependent receptor [Candidatus Pseudobacter hemicellulosilyticus]|uniref:TonB-dependent receptor n=1 Tax=Candidatus Pseudobacter hemicellulosilyticus TaxID=3121375 RepID=A0AAJ5WRD6_9BACT|nr:MAG: TonB-dependent receptor [Pseudobacter sp.]